MNEDRRSRGGLLGRLMGLGAIILPVVLGVLGARKSNRPAEQLQESIEVGHETRDLSVRGVAWFIVFLVVMGAFALVVTTTVLVLSSKQGGISFQFPPTGLANVPAPTLPPEPRLESVPGQVLDPLRKSDAETLNSYGWVDQEHGVVRIPIDRAIELLLQVGLPSRPDGTQFQDQGTQSPSYPSSGRRPSKFP